MPPQPGGFDPRYGQPGPQPPGQGWPVPPTAAPKKKRRIWPWVFLILLIPLVLIGGCVAFVVSLAGAPIGATNEFVAHLDDGELAQAYDRLCTQTQDARTFEEFEADMASAEQITGYTFSSVSVETGDFTMVTGTIDLSGTPVATSFGLQQEGDEWRICAYEPLP